MQRVYGPTPKKRESRRLQSSVSHFGSLSLIKVSKQDAFCPVIRDMARSPIELLSSVIIFAFLVGCAADGLEEVADYPEAVMPPPPHQPSTNTPVRNWTDSTLQPGDVIELFVEEDRSLNGTYPVRERGDIILPNVGRIPVRGMTVTDAGARIRSELEASQLRKATVIVDRVSKAPRKKDVQTVRPSTNQPQSRVTIYMNGSVLKPGQHKIPVPESGKLGVYEAILVAGGLGKFGDPARVHILRNDGQGKKRKIPVNIKDIEMGLTKDPMIGDGDIIVVPEKVFGF